MLQGVKLSQTQCPTIAEDREKMKVIPYASAIGSIMYAMLCTRLKEICPRGNNKVVIYISLYHDKCLLFMLEWY